jgi:hypothetical protein
MGKLQPSMHDWSDSAGPQDDERCRVEGHGDREAKMSIANQFMID